MTGFLDFVYKWSSFGFPLMLIWRAGNNHVTRRVLQNRHIWVSGRCIPLFQHFLTHTYTIIACDYDTERESNLCSEAVIDGVQETRIFIQCSCLQLVAPLRGYESVMWRTRMLLPNTGRKVTDWLLHGFIRCGYLHILIIWSTTASLHLFGVCGYDDAERGK